MMDVRRTLVWWKVRCLNRQDKTFFDRCLVLNWSRLSPEQQAHVLTLVEDSGSKPAILQYRPSFHEVDEEELLRQLQQAQWTRRVSLPDYFEGEDAQPMGEIGLMKDLTGEEYPILLGNPLSVLRLGPTGVQRKEEWSAKVANDIAHLLQTVRQIDRSEWLRNPLSLQFVPKPHQISVFPDIDRVISFDGPDNEATRSVLLLIRQLVSSDDVLNTACNWYLKHVADDRKRSWVGERKSRFNASRLSQPDFFKV